MKKGPTQGRALHPARPDPDFFSLQGPTLREAVSSLAPDTRNGPTQGRAVLQRGERIGQAEPIGSGYGYHLATSTDDTRRTAVSGEPAGGALRANCSMLM